MNAEQTDMSSAALWTGKRLQQWRSHAETCTGPHTPLGGLQHHCTVRHILFCSLTVSHASQHAQYESVHQLRQHAHKQRPDSLAPQHLSICRHAHAHRVTRPAATPQVSARRYGTGTRGVRAPRKGRLLRRHVVLFLRVLAGRTEVQLHPTRALLMAKTNRP